mgnify:CR=1 FL=1
MCLPIMKAVSRHLRTHSGNILLTTGSKELAVFAPLKERLFVRVLPGLESIGLCEKAGIRGKQILAMQGPFSEEMNLAMIHQFSIRYLVTKASGAHSGFQEKLAAAQKAGITACVIGKQEQEQGMSYAQVTETLSRLLGHTISGRPEVEISLIGIGMSAATLTQEAKRALEESDVVFGAERMLEVVENSKETYPFYLAKDILPVLRQKESQMDGQKLKVSILFSGDTGFYSGTEKIKTELNKNNYKKNSYFSRNFIRFLPLCGNGNCLAGCKNYKYPREKRYRRDQSTRSRCNPAFSQDVSAGFRGGGCPTDRMLDRRRKIDANPHDCWVSAFL